jgi:hypothetical protein
MRVVLCQLRLVHEALAVGGENLVERLHVVLRLAAFLPVLHPLHVREWRERAFVHDALFADSAPARLLGGIVHVGRPAMHEIARTGFVDPILRVVEPVGVGHRVEVVEVAEELVEAVQGRQVFVEVAEMVLAELAGRVAERFQHGGKRARLGRHADIRTRLAHRGEAGPQGKLAGDEVRAPRGAACLGVVVGEAHALGGEPIKVRRLARHDSLVIGADVEPTDVVAHDDKNVGLASAVLGACGAARRARRQTGDRRKGGSPQEHVAAAKRLARGFIAHGLGSLIA